MTAASQLPPEFARCTDWTVDDLAGLPPDLNYELINGRLILPSLTLFHQDICRLVANALDANCPPDYAVSFDLSIAIDRRNEARPDVAVVPVRYAGVSPVPFDGAQLVVEVIPQSQRFRDMVDKERAYAKARIPTYWIIEPTSGQINLIEHLLGPDGDYHYGEATSDVYTTDRPWKVTLDLPALSARHRAMREHANASDHQ
ncbi:MAG TPA: Uma2 family endonuclease [Candidatus Limnocylindrales bacterium]|nr:Uma2 family endonuclease [Candidatus Limnocylindrales bacterium]